MAGSFQLQAIEALDLSMRTCRFHLTFWGVMSYMDKLRD
jgi:hypothetical protein